ncbi:DUF2214 family protein [Pseudomonas sp. NPDC078700]|uniref:DUF2214 family protein n=1 Tax=Pseudomonas sp. NPDC078700 TaxID=3364424 RepID=UPI0037C57E7F
MGEAIAAYLHYISIFGLFALLSIEHVTFNKELDLARARRLVVTDLAYGVCAGVVLLTGLVRVIWYGKGWQYYVSNSVFHGKVTLFILVGLISVYPTYIYLNWRNSLQAGQPPVITRRQAFLITMSIRLELLLLLIIPLLATFMARGFGVMGAG